MLGWTLALLWKLCRSLKQLSAKHREITYRDCHHWVVLEFPYQREPIQTDSLPRRCALRPNHDTVDQKGDRVPADIQQDSVPLIIEKRSLRAEDNSLSPTAQCCEGKLQRLWLPIESDGQLLVAIHILHLPDIPVFIDGAATHAQHSHIYELLWEAEGISWSETQRRDYCENPNIHFLLNIQ